MPLFLKFIIFFNIHSYNTITLRSSCTIRRGPSSSKFWSKFHFDSGRFGFSSVCSTSFLANFYTKSFTIFFSLKSFEGLNYLCSICFDLAQLQYKNRMDKAFVSYM
jgi:hypothetical protein